MQPRDPDVIESGYCACRRHQCCKSREQRDFGTSSFYAQLSDKQGSSVTTVYMMWTRNTMKLHAKKPSACPLLGRLHFIRRLRSLEMALGHDTSSPNLLLKANKFRPAPPGGVGYAYMGGRFCQAKKRRGPGIRERYGRGLVTALEAWADFKHCHKSNTPARRIVQIKGGLGHFRHCRRCYPTFSDKETRWR